MKTEELANLWELNTPDQFWHCFPNPPPEIWSRAIQRSLPSIGLERDNNFEDLIQAILGESRFGLKRWDLNSQTRIYYEIKPFLPRVVINFLKKIKAQVPSDNFLLKWPIEDRYVNFLWKVFEQVKIISNENDLSFRPFWPEGKDYAFVLTHDVETIHGQSNIARIADLEESFGFRSSFNFVPERYKLDHPLINDLRQRGFEIGVHGLKHDGKLYFSHDKFIKRAEKINHYLNELGAVGFRSPLMHRNPYWLQALKIEYDLSFFDTDPYEPMPGGCMSIWPYFIGHFVELPYTLVQDCTLVMVLGEKTPRIWLEKVSFIEKYHGMALLNSHPDYLNQPDIWNIYVRFLEEMKERRNYWHVLPQEVARWWRFRLENKDG